VLYLNTIINGATDSEGNGSKQDSSGERTNSSSGAYAEKDGMGAKDAGQGRSAAARTSMSSTASHVTPTTAKKRPAVAMAANPPQVLLWRVRCAGEAQIGDGCTIRGWVCMCECMCVCARVCACVDRVASPNKSAPSNLLTQERVREIEVSHCVVPFLV